MNKRLKAILLIILASVLLVAGCSSGFTAAQGPQPGNPAPDFQLLNLEGQNVSLSSLRGKPVLINFWASWCPPCRAEMPFIQQIFEDEEWSDKGLVILAINIGESPDTVKRFMASYGLSFPERLLLQLLASPIYLNALLSQE